MVQVRSVTPPSSRCDFNSGITACYIAVISTWRALDGNHKWRNILSLIIDLNCDNVNTVKFVLFRASLKTTLKAWNFSSRKYFVNLVTEIIFTHLKLSCGSLALDSKQLCTKTLHRAWILREITKIPSRLWWKNLFALAWFLSTATRKKIFDKKKLNGKRINMGVKCLQGKYETL